ncbi:MAG: winged helix-turn-helix transcriptional regulator [Thermotogae bacterium]|nr:winged helix-turn-helix transcriptional regulator [Thermotogota bacterium]
MHLYPMMFSDLIKEYQLTQNELDILLFLANNPIYDTAKDIVEVRHLTKSHVSVSVDDLVKRGLLERNYLNDNHKVIHLCLLPASMEIIEKGRQCQKHFLDLLFDGILKEEREKFATFLEQLSFNARKAYKEGM